MLDAVNSDVLILIAQECVKDSTGYEYYTQYNAIRNAFSFAFKSLPKLSQVKVISDKYDSHGGVFKTNYRNDMFCVNANCYNDTLEFCSQSFGSPDYLHSHQTASIGSHYCTFCRMSLILNGINCRIKSYSFEVN